MKLQTEDGGVVEVFSLRGTMRLAIRDTTGTAAVTITDQEAAVIETMLSESRER